MADITNRGKVIRLKGATFDLAQNNLATTSSDRFILRMKMQAPYAASEASQN